nr:MAG TPA: cholesterol side-chain cleavage enzyme [Caudoviricetes sp.]
MAFGGFPRGCPSVYLFIFVLICMLISQQFH